MSFQSQFNFPVKKKGISGKSSENISPFSVKRALFDETPLVSPKKARFTDENRNRTPIKNKLKSSTDSSSSLVQAKQAFHTGLPSRLIGRSKEISDIRCFFNEHIDGKKPGSLYMSGAPGTGKTSSLMFVKESMDTKFSFAFINCMSVNTPAAIYKSIAKELRLSPKITNSKNISDALRKHILSSDSMTVLVLDEIDQLDTKGQQILYTIFEWPHLPKSTLIVVGIANSLDLTDRMLPRLQTFKCQPKLMHFQPYSKDQIVSILEDRLSDVASDGTAVIKPIAVQLCARKIAANTGDIRKALDVCRRAIEVVENRMKKSPILQQTADDRQNPGSPQKRVTAVACVDLQDISAVLHEVYGSRLQSSGLPTSSGSSAQTVTMPLQQMVTLCTLVLLQKNCKPQDLTMGKAYDTYRRICNKRDIGPVDECAFNSLCRLLESRSFVQLKANKIARAVKISLKLDEHEAEYVMQDKALLPLILADRSVLSK